MLVTMLTCLAVVTATPQTPQLTITDESAIAVAGPGMAADVAVVASPAFHVALEPWLAYRQGQGHRIALISNHGGMAEIRRRLRAAGEGGKLRWIVLIGDAASDDGRAPLGPLEIPTAYATATVLPKFGGSNSIATDNAYADLNDDGQPEIAVGRIPVDTPEELAQAVKRIIHYEQQAGDLWRTRVNLVAGVGGFGKVADFVLESATRHFLTNEIPASYMTSMTYGSWRSPFCPDPKQFHAATVDRFNEGCMFWVYIGHGNRRYLDQVQVPGGAFHILDVNDTRNLQSHVGRPIAIFLACYTGAFDAEQDCLAEEMLRSPGGAVGVLAGSRVTMPYAMAVMGDGIIRRYFHSDDATLGEIVLGSKKLMLQPPEAERTFNRQLLDSLASTFSPSQETLADELREHVYLFNLLGDPLLRIKRPAPLIVRAAPKHLAGTSCQFQIESPIAGRARVEIVCRRDRLTFTAPDRAEFAFTTEALQEMQRTYNAANDRTWIKGDLDIIHGVNAVQIDVPREANGHAYVRVYVRGEHGDAAGASKIFIDSKPTTAAGKPIPPLQR
jgi:hypothetical protein